MQARGKPAVMVLTEPFVSLAEHQRKAFGVQDLPLGVVKHPVGGRPPEEAREKAQRVIGAIAEALTHQTPKGKA